MSEIFAIDVGGTFTDVVALDSESGTIRLAKTPTTPHAPLLGVLRGIDKAGVSLDVSDAFFHGTTIGINTLLQRQGARTGLITSKGCRDVLEIARMAWPMYRLHWDQPAPLVPRWLRTEVNERIRADGAVLAEFTDDELHDAVSRLLENGAEVIAVCFLHAYAFPEHEVRAGDLIACAFPGLPFSLSHFVSREYREYERTSTTVVDAMIRGTMTDYLDDLNANLRESRFGGDLFITRCDGGVMSLNEARQQTIRTLTSGPVSGVAGALTLSDWLDLESVIAIDMGGTSFDASLIVNGRPTMKAATKLEEIPLLMPVIEVTSIGAGGGSIAWIDEGGALNVGPQSAGADPGPIAYGKGGTEPTFTDAAIVSGLLDPARFLGGEILLDTSAAWDGIEQRIAVPLGLSTEAAASGIVALIETKMALTLEEITIGEGFDPRDFALIAYGGGGSLVAAALANRLEIPLVVVPRSPAAFSAWGMLTLDIVHDFSETRVGNLDTLSPDAFASTFRSLEERARDALNREGIAVEAQRIEYRVDMRYQLQEHSLTLPLPWSPQELDRGELQRIFHTAHTSAYGYEMDEPVQVVAYRVRGVASLPKPPQRGLASGSEASSHALKGARHAVHRESGGGFQWDVYDRDLLLAGNVVVGPAIIEEPTATTVISPFQRAVVDGLGNILLTPAQ